MALGYKAAIKRALESNATLATPLYVIVRKHFGDDAFFWDPSTLYLELRSEFGAEPTAEAIDRLSAAQVIVTSDAFFTRPDAFINLCNTLSSGAPGFSLFDPVTVEEAAWAIVEVSLIRDMLPFGYGVKTLIQQILAGDGYDDADYPDIFDEALERAPSSADVHEIVEQVVTEGNTLHDQQRDVVNEFIDDQMRSLTFQFHEVPGMSDDLYELIREKEIEDMGALI